MSVVKSNSSTVDFQISVAGTPTDEKSGMHSAPNYAGIEEVFDIMPLYGLIQPGESQRLMLSVCKGLWCICVEVPLPQVLQLEM